MIPWKSLPAFTGIVVFSLAASALTRAAETITQEELVRRSQELFDAVAPGDQAPWKKYFADDCLFSDEKGRNMDKAALVADVQPLPSGYSGTIKVVHPKSLILGNTAILSYDTDETENVCGQPLTARYHTTDTWQLRRGAWQIVASQTNRYYEDPAAGSSDPAHFADYAGTYELAPGKILRVTTAGEKLYLQRGDAATQQLVPEAEGIFFRAGVEGRVLFRHDAIGKTDALISRRNNQDVVWRKTNYPVETGLH